jgi:hypothetical protein
MSPPRPPAKSRKWAAALLLAAVHLGVLAAWIALPFLDWRWLPVSILAIPLLVPLESLLLTPVYTLSGRFRYHSPLLLSTRRAGGGLDLHVGTLYDYVRRLRWSERGPRAARIVTTDLLQGLLNLCEAVERGDLPPETEVVATSYFFSDRTLARLGFEMRRAPSATVQNLALASLNIALRLSFTRGRPTFPDLRRVRQGVTSAGALAQHRATIARSLHRLSRANGADSARSAP